MRGIKEKNAALMFVLIVVLILSFIPSAAALLNAAKQAAEVMEAGGAEEYLPPAPVMIVSKVLLSLSIAFALNFLIILIYSRKKTLSDEEILSGSCCNFKIKEADTELQKKKKRPGIF